MCGESIKAVVDSQLCSRLLRLPDQRQYDGNDVCPGLQNSNNMPWRVSESSVGIVNLIGKTKSSGQLFD